jgi:toxin ParE1/3/4
MRLEWSRAAIFELDEIRTYIAERNRMAAERVKDRIINATELLASRPYIGRVGRSAGSREFVFSDIPYIAIYDVNEDIAQVTILHIFHTSRLYPPKEWE